MVNYVQTTQLLGRNGVDTSEYNFLTGVVSGGTTLIPTVGTKLAAFYWRIPKVITGLAPTAYSWLIAKSSVRPTVDSQKVRRMENGNTTYDIAVADTDGVGGVDQFATLADGLGGSLATMPVVTITWPLIQDAPVTTGATSPAFTKTFTFAFPNNPLGLLYSIPYAYFNGGAPVTPYAPSGITTAALFVTWANANWGTYGTWTSTGNIVNLASVANSGTYVLAAGFSPQLAQAAWCIDATTLYPAGQIATAALNAGGTGYAVGDTVSVNTGGGNAILTVASLSTTAVATFTVTYGGTGYAVATGVATTAITGTGTGFVINISTLRTEADSPVNGIQFGTNPAYSFGAFNLSNTNSSMQQLVNSIRRFFESSAVIAVGGSNGEKVSISTTLGVVHILNNASTIVSSTSGACS